MVAIPKSRLRDGCIGDIAGSFLSIWPVGSHRLAPWRDEPGIAWAHSLRALPGGVCFPPLGTLPASARAPAAARRSVDASGTQHGRMPFQPGRNRLLRFADTAEPGTERRQGGRTEGSDER